MKSTGIITGLLFCTLFLLSAQQRMSPGTVEYAEGASMRLGRVVEISGSIENVSGNWIRLASYYGDRFTVIDSLEQAGGFFFFTLPENTASGLYRIIYSESNDSLLVKNRFVEFIVAGEYLEIQISSGEDNPELNFESSDENRVYQEFQDYELYYEQELENLYPDLNPERDNQAYLETVSRYEWRQNERRLFLDSLTGAHPGLYASRLIRAFQSPFVPGNLTHRERIDTLKQCFFDRAAINDPALLYAPVYAYKILDYLSLYAGSSADRDSQEEHFIQAIDQLMLHVSGDEELRNFVVVYLLEGFEKLDMELVQLHIAENYLDESCESDLVDLILERMEGYKQMAVGMHAPEFTIADAGGRVFSSADFQQDYLLLLFWSSTCDHCYDMLPKFKAWYEGEARGYELEIVAISIDTSTQAFMDYMAVNDYPWLTAHEERGWYGETASAYFIYATPAMFLLDRDRKIVARPNNFRQFLRQLRKLEPCRLK